MRPGAQSVGRSQAGVFTDFCVQFISGFVFCKRKEKEIVGAGWGKSKKQREREREVGF